MHKHNGGSLAELPAAIHIDIGQTSKWLEPLWQSVVHNGGFCCLGHCSRERESIVGSEREKQRGRERVREGEGYFERHGRR